MVTEKDTVLLEKVGVAEAPSKDYGQLLVTNTQIIFRLWRITPRIADAIKYRPKQWIDAYADFLGDEGIQREIHRFFGPHVLEEVKNYAIGGNGLLKLPENVMIRVAIHLSLLDLKRLGRVCQALNLFCKSNNLWHALFQRYYATYPVIPDALVKVAAKQGWKRVFFTNKLQLQVQLRKEQRTIDSGRSSNNASYYSASDDNSSPTKASVYDYSPKLVPELDGISFDGRQTSFTPQISDKDSPFPDTSSDRLFDPVESKIPIQNEIDATAPIERVSTELLPTANEYSQNAAHMRPSSTPATSTLRDGLNS